MAASAIFVALCLLVTTASCSDVNESENEILSSRDNFVITNTLSDGEVERRVRFNGVSAKETAVSLDASGNATGGPKLWQAAQGKKFIQLIYDANGRLVDCEYFQSAEVARQFVEQFDAETETYVDKFHLHDGNVTVKHVRFLRDIDAVVRDLSNYRGLRRSCKRLHRYVRKFAEQSVQSSTNATLVGDEDAGSTRQKRNTKSSPNSPLEALMPGTKWCGSGSSAGQWAEIGSYSGADLCCREHDHCPFKVNGMGTNYGYFNYRVFTVSHCDCDERKRGVGEDSEFSPRIVSPERILSSTGDGSINIFMQRRDVLMLVRVPGTQWCGVGSRTENENELGGFMSADRCCRIHDLECPYYIHTLTERYGLYNWRAYTLNHCDCDERFRTCLKMTDSAASNMVGKIFFNIIQTKCFVLKPEKVCSKRSWWGKCLKEELERKAHIRDAMKY